MEFLIIAVLSGIIFGLVGMAIGDLGGKKNGRTGFVLGLLLGPFGCVIAAVIPASASSEKVQKEEAEKTRLAKLESELAALKAKPAAAAPKRVIPAREDDGQIPVYRLD